MNMFSLFPGLFGSWASAATPWDGSTSTSSPARMGSTFSDESAVNPANGLPMIGGMAGMDMAGNPFATDFLHDHSSSSLCDDSFTSGCSGSDDIWTSSSSGGLFD